MGTWLISAVDPDDVGTVDAVHDVLSSYHDELLVTIGHTTLTAELDTLPAPYTPPDGALLLACDEDGRPAGCVGVKGLGDRECEVKRLYVMPHARGVGLGRALVRAAMDQARAMGYSEMMLLAVRQTTAGAQRIYRDLGFEETGPFREPPLGWDPGLFLFMRRPL
ncbi:MAG: N-acetyltransferase [Coriobacteriia bacterium]|nr:N-acetyltransferase [Coriobacteriia bacterium]